MHQPILAANINTYILPIAAVLGFCKCVDTVSKLNLWLRNQPYMTANSCRVMNLCDNTRTEYSLG